MMALSNRRGLIWLVIAAAFIGLFVWSFSALEDLRRGNERFRNAESRFEAAALEGQASEAAAARSDREAARSANRILAPKAVTIVVGASLTFMLALSLIRWVFPSRRSGPISPATRRPPAR